MNGLTRFGIDHSRFTALVMIGLILQGIITYIGLPKRENPAITIRSAVVSVQFPGMAPDRIEDLIVTPMERKIREIGEVEDINTLISTGRAKITVNAYDRITQAELEPMFQDLRNKMDDVQRDLPDGTIGPFVNTDYGDVAIATIAVTGEGFDFAELKVAAEELQRRLYEVDGVSKVSLSGQQEERIWLEIDSRKLAAVGVQLPQVIQDLTAQNVILPAGQLDADGLTLILEANGDLNTVDEIRNVLTKVQGLAGFVRLEDLMTVRRGYVDPPEKPIWFNGAPAIMVSVEMADSADIQDLGQRLKTAVRTIENSQPIGIAFSFSTFQETNVTASIEGALSNVGQTFGVVVLVLLVFLGLRPALIVACIVPFTVMFALILIKQLGIEIQQISIAAVIISLGLLVDNGLVVVEDIQGRIKAGEDPREAALHAGRQYFGPLAVASVTTVSAFIPMLIIDGTSGEFAFSLGAVVAAMLLGSWITAMYILPALAVWFGSRKVKAEAGPSLIVRIYGGLVRRSLPYGLLIIPIAYGLVVASSTVFSTLKAEQFPLAERAEYLIYLDMPKGAAITRTAEEARAVDAWLRNPDLNPEVVSTTLFVGDGGPRFYLALNPADTNAASAFILVNTVDFEGAVTAAARAYRYLNEERPAARFKVKRLSMGGAESGIVEIKITGPDAEKLLALAAEVEAGFAVLPGVTQNENDWGNKQLKLVIDIAQDKARELGVTSEDVSDVMETFFSGARFSTYREGDEAIPIMVRAAESYRDSLEDLANLSISVNGGLVSLDQFATFRPKLEYSQLRRENQVRSIKVSAKSETLSGAQLLEGVRPALEALDLPSGYAVEIDGETANAAETNEKLGAGMPLALTVMLAALMVQFNSARRVALTFMTIPLIVIGAPLALKAMGQPLSFFAILGLISLMGIIINNAIVLIDQIDIERQTRGLADAVTEAAKKRVTPILLTSLTTVFGLAPMALAGGALFEPMATLMIGGLVIASFLTLFFVPSAYYLLFGGLRRQS